ncbi:type II 3-dehydroquinate dehydratase [Bacillus thuringiensis]|uniref:type II 3-dehydroquinate dehydratase n=1 Tax=Bacillus thuringiensis TaxID=1428 RepID=UPI000BFCB3A7|nr:type II 3-dehydroquinate dehydratase [Bacillus thuringiensis]MDA1764002.1 type II 3-dehydroquinate dehydratase [Bacillus cereus]PGO54950.1 type II 3-dehydroquinate dehydratase [Bacillus thuringiensis]
MRKFLVINGPNLNLLGKREPHIYGELNLKRIQQDISQKYLEICMVDFYQSNYEGDIITQIHNSDEGYDGVIINPGAFMSYSYSIRDAISSVSTPIIEVHLSNIYSREDFRHHSVIAPVTQGTITGLGHIVYSLGVEALLYLLEEQEN